MKELCSKVQQDEVVAVSVCHALDVFAVVCEQSVTMYRMPMSKLWQSDPFDTMKARAVCWSPSGKTLVLGGSDRTLLLNVEDGCTVGKHPVDAVAVEWVTRKTGGAVGTRPFHKLEEVLFPLLLPPELPAASDPPTELVHVFRERFALLEEVAHQQPSFLAIASSDGTVHLYAYGMTCVAAVRLPSPSPFGLTSTLDTLIQVDRAGKVAGYPLPSLPAVPQLRSKYIAETTLLLRGGLVGAMNEIRTVERELENVIAGAPTGTMLSCGPVGKAKEWVLANCTSRRVAKFSDAVFGAIARAHHLLLDNLAPAVDHIWSASQMGPGRLLTLIQDVLPSALRELHAHTTAIVGWLTLLHHQASKSSHPPSPPCWPHILSFLGQTSPPPTTPPPILLTASGPKVTVLDTFFATLQIAEEMKAQHNLSDVPPHPQPPPRFTGDVGDGSTAPQAIAVRRGGALLYVARAEEEGGVSIAVARCTRQAIGFKKHVVALEGRECCALCWGMGGEEATLHCLTHRDGGEWMVRTLHVTATASHWGAELRLSPPPAAKPASPSWYAQHAHISCSARGLETVVIPVPSTTQPHVVFLAAIDLDDDEEDDEEGDASTSNSPHTPRADGD